MFERFTDRARRVVVLAQEEARLLNHNYIGTEHILLGLIHEGEGVAAKSLESLGISLEGVRSQVEEIILENGLLTPNYRSQTWMDKHKLWQTNTPLSVATPTQIKKYATGSGAATKEHMYSAWVEETGMDLMQEMTPKRSNVGNPISDIVDAYYICKYLFHEGGLKVDP